MNILVACEESGVVCQAFRAKGHNAFSCDILDTSGSYPEWHVKGDVLQLLPTPIAFTTCDGVVHHVDKWDMLIAFPPCTYLARVGACNNSKDSSRIAKGFLAKDFFMQLFNADIERICIENPIPQKRFCLPTPSMRFQPYEFGHDFTKYTYLWLKNLPPLMPTVCPFQGRKYPSWCAINSNGKKDRAKIRSKTFPNVAVAMAMQWG